MESPLPEITVRGYVKWFNPVKGYGFILDQQGQEFFVHYSAIEKDGFRTLQDGDVVEFTPRNGVKGLAAHKVRKIAPKTDQESRPPNDHNGPDIPAQAKAMEAGPEASAHQPAGSHIHIDVESSTLASFVASAAANFGQIGRLSKDGRKSSRLTPF